MSPSSILQTIRQNPLILPLYLPSLTFAFCQGLLDPILPLYVDGFGVSYVWIGIVLAGQGVGMLLGDVPAGVLLRHVGQKRAMLLGIGCAALTTVALFWTNTIIIALLCRLIGGFGIALFNIARHAYMAEIITLASRGRAIALFGGVNRIGRFVGPLTSGFVAGAYGLRAPFLLFAGACIVALVLVGRFIQATQPASTPGRATAKLHHSHFLEALKVHYQILTKAGTGQLFAQMIRAGRAIIIPLYAAKVLGLGVEEIGLIIGIAAAVDMTLFYPAGYVMDHWGRKFSIIPCFFIQAIGMGLVPLTGGFTGLLLATVLIGFGNGLGSGTMMTLGADLAPLDSRGEFLGVWRLVGDVGHTGAPIVVGGVANLVGLQMGALAMSGAGLIAVAIFAFWVPETLKKRVIFMK